ncbi:hypothetical protein Rctr197k_077 [Virus Rctr197k]|nr:hypothetical protein Rctr197k_077 [Virus Rctr197k]
MSRTFQVTNGDWVLDRRVGRPVMVSGRAKLQQDIREDLSIATQPNGFGAGLDDLVGLDIDPAGFKIEVQRRVRDSVTALQRLQDRYLSSQRSAQERVAGISKLTVSSVSSGGGDTRTGYTFQLGVRPVAGEILVASGSGS